MNKTPATRNTCFINKAFIEAICGAETTNRKTIITIIWVLFENEINGDEPDKSSLLKRLDDIIKKNKSSLSDTINRELAKNAIGGIVDRYNKIDKIIGEVSKSRVTAPIERNILRFGVFGLKFGKDYGLLIGESAVKDEAIEIAKNLLDEGASRFINAILTNPVVNKDRVIKAFIEAICGAETTNRKTIITIVWVLFENDGDVLDEGVLMNCLEDIIEKNKLSDINKGFAENSIRDIVNKYNEIDKIIDDMSTRPLGSIGLIERNILRFGVFGLKFGRTWDTPMVPLYVINQVIELAKNLVGESAGKFINGVLGGLVPDEPRQLPVKQVGGIIFIRNSGTLKFSLVKTAYKKWSLPKGKLREGEDLKEGFKRALKKEIGIEVEVIKKIHSDSFTDGPIKKEAVYFLGTTNNWELCLEKKPGLTKANWFTYEEVKKLDLDSALKPMILRYMDEVIKECLLGRIERIRRWILNWLRSRLK